MAYELASVARKKAAAHPEQREAVLRAYQRSLALAIHWDDVDHSLVADGPLGQRLEGAAGRHDAAALERAIRRLFLSAVLDTTTTLDEVRAELYALIEGRPLAPEDGALRPGPNGAESQRVPVTELTNP